MSCVHGELFLSQAMTTLQAGFITMLYMNQHDPHGNATLKNQVESSNMEPACDQSCPA
jgi:hypothetical protein